MTNKFRRNSSLAHEYVSAAERELGETLEKTLTPPWKLAHRAEALAVRSTDGGIEYTPDIVITNEATGQVLAIEVKSILSLSLPNILKLQHVQSAFQQKGAYFLLVVHGESPGTAGTDVRLREYGINAVGVNQAADAASEIGKQLESR